MTALTEARRRLTERPGPRLSQVLLELRAGEGGRVSVGDIAAALQGRSFAPLMVVLAAPNVFLFVPGSSAFTGVPLMFLAAQLILGRPTVWLPRFVAERSVERASFDRIVGVSVPHIARIERLARPRWWPRASRLTERMIGAATLVLAMFLSLPIPFANGLPALAIVMLAMALSQRDGYWLVAGFALTLVSLAIVAGMISVGGSALLEFFVP